MCYKTMRMHTGSIPDANINTDSKVDSLQVHKYNNTEMNNIINNFHPGSIYYFKSKMISYSPVTFDKLYFTIPRILQYPIQETVFKMPRQICKLKYHFLTVN